MSHLHLFQMSKRTTYDMVAAGAGAAVAVGVGAFVGTLHSESQKHHIHIYYKTES